MAEVTGLYIKAKELVNLLVERAKKVTLPFFDGMPIYNVSMFFWRSIVDGAITTRASAIAFSFFLALFPSIIFMFTLIPYIPIENFQDQLLLLINDIVPQSTYITIEETIHDIILVPHSGLLSLGFFMALIFSTNGIASMMSAFDATIHTYTRRNWVSQRITSIMLLFILWVMLTVTVALITGGQIAQDYLIEHDIIRKNIVFYLFTFGKWIIIVALFFFAYSFLYYYAPAKRSKFRFISAGGSLATVLSIFAIIGFTYYINNFGQYNKLYGSIGTLLVILLMIYIVSLILLVGFELNASIRQAHKEVG